MSLNDPDLKWRTHAADHRKHLDAIVEDVAGRLEKKATQIRTVAGMTPKDLTKEQFDAMCALICAMR